MRTLFSSSFRALATSLGIDLDEYFESRYLKYRKRRSVYIKYATGRVPGSREDPRRIFRFYNDLKTVPSQETIDRATFFFTNLVADIKGDDFFDVEQRKVKLIAQWINDTAVYDTDSHRWGSIEFWSSPFDLWKEYELTGSFTDDCDGWAALMLWACSLVGVSEDRLFMWAGNARLDDGSYPYGHSNLVYDNPLYGVCHVEGSLYPKDNQRRWLKYVFGRSDRYPDTWFMFNSSEITG